MARWAEDFNRMADSLQATVTRLEDAQGQNRRFVADVTHELRTPLTALVAEASVLEGSLDGLPPDGRRAAQLLVADVRRLRTLGARRLLFLDDNPVARPEEAKELFRRLIPLDVQWVSQVTINVARDPELLDLVARSGARVLSIGFESISDESLASVAKSFNRPSRFREDIAKIRARGIQVIALIMVGLDGDTPETFAATLRWLDENKISFLKLFTPAPYPGTKFHADMTAAGRILDEDWGHYDYGSPVVRPANMSPQEMIDGFRYVYSGFYSVRSMLRRFVPPPRRNLLETLAMVVANAKVSGYLRRNPAAWGTIS